MKVSKQHLGVLLIVLFASLTIGTGELLASSSYDPPLVNWAAPATYTLPRSGSGFHLMAGELGGGPMPFFPVTPCRQYDSRNSTPLPSGVNRTVTLTGAPCGVPSLTLAVSVNITIFNITGAGSNGVFKVDTVSPPAFAWINYPPTETQRGNAGVVPLTSGGGIIVQAAQGAGQIDFTVDINGYYNNGTAFQPLPVNDFFGIVANYPFVGGVIYGANTNTAAIQTFGGNFNDSSTGAKSAGVNGSSFATTGATSGVLGTTNSTSTLASGVRGIAASGEPAGAGSCCSDLGVLGESKNGTGVGGISENIAGFFDLKNSGGSIIAGGFAGYQIGTNNYAFYASPGDFGGAGAKYFIEPHPTAASKVIRYVSLEGPESGTYFRGTAQTARGTAVIDVPEDFRIVTDEEGLTIQLTPVGAAATMYVMSQDLNQIVVKASRDVKFHYMVNGVRRAFKDHQPIIEGLEFMPSGPEARMAEGFRPELKQRLISNGTYNADGTVNLTTAERMGWTKVWADRAAQTAAAATKAREERKPVSPNQ